MRALDVDTGYEAKHVLQLDLGFPAAFGYTHAKKLAEIDQIRRQLLSPPGVAAVTCGRSPDGGGLRSPLPFVK